MYIQSKYIQLIIVNNIQYDEYLTIGYTSY